MAQPKRGGGRYLATVLFTDLVDSTRLASELGDERWRELLAQQRELVRRQLRLFEGREIDTAGDGFFAVFDAPARAVACALAITELVPGLGAQVRAGVHMGEVEQMGRGLGGIAVHIGARIAAAADAGQVLVSSTVRDLVAGSGIEFDDRGTRELKGVPGEWHLYSARSDAVVGKAPAPAAEAAAVRSWITERKRRRRLMLAAGLVGAIAIVVLVTFVATRPPPSLTAVGENSAGVIDLESGRIVGAVPVGSRPDGVAYGENAIWVANYSDGTVSRIDPRTRALVQTIEVGEGPSGIAVGFGSVWVANSGDRSVSRINPTTNGVVQEVEVGNGPTGIVAAAGAVWVTNAVDGTLTRIDASSGIAGPPVNVGATPNGVTADDSAVWVANLEPGTVARIDPLTSRVVDSIQVGNGPRSVALGGGSLWVANSRDGTVSRIDVASNRVTDTVPVGDGASGIVAAEGVTWVGSALADFVYRIDHGGSNATTVNVGAAAQGLAVAGDELWFSARPSAASHRGGTLHVVTDGIGLGQLNSVDPAVAFFTTEWFVVTLVHDGLVGYERSGGVGGASLVPNLAVSLPQPSDGGTTYTFRLRPNIKYSNGEPVRPGDFRRAVERAYSVPDGSGGTNPYLSGIVGAVECADRPGQPCDLSSGIVTDETTITYHLTAADPEFLSKLALPFSYAVPASTPDDDMGRGALPATGPYQVSSYTDTEIRLGRNPLFEEWSRAARPDGYPDEVVISIGPSRDDQVQMVLSGTADVMTDRIEAARMTAVQLQQPALVHPAVLGTVTMFMNVTVAPFDDVNVRKAVNLAVDRAKVVELLGGPLSDTVTCQVIPPNTPGYAPYCPYTLNVNPAGTWTAPDLATARDLVAASGKAGSHVEVGTFGRFPPAASHIVDVLNGLGFVAELEVSPDDQTYFAKLLDPIEGPLVQAGVVPWISDYPAASSATVPYRCGEPVNLARLCDEDLEALFDSALEMQQTDPVAAGQRWSEVDRAIVDLAPVAPLTNVVWVDLVSERVGNYQRHPQWSVLLDQLWVK